LSKILWVGGHPKFDTALLLGDVQGQSCLLGEHQNEAYPEKLSKEKHRFM